MKALTICQPYASLIIHGINGSMKRVENRTWPTSHRGRLLIHAGKSREWFYEEEHADLPRGVLLGTVEVIDCVRIEEYRRKYDGADPFANGPWCWVLRDPQGIPEIPWRGAMGLFEVPDSAVPEAMA